MKANGAAQRRPRKVFIVDDHDGIRLSMEIILAGQPDLEFCGGVKEYSDALPEIEKRRPHLVLVDLKLDGRGGIELTKEIQRQFPGTAVLIYSGFEEDRYGARAFRAGARGFLEKGVGMDETRAVIRSILQGRLYFKEQTLHFVRNSMNGCGNGSNGSAPRRDVDQLSDREFEVLGLLGLGLSPRKISDKLHLGVASVRTWRKRIRRKPGFATSMQLVQFATRWAEEEEPSSESSPREIAP